MAKVNNRPPPDLEPLAVEPKDLTYLLGIGENQVYTLINRTDFPTVRLTERKVIIPVADLKQWLHKQVELKLEANMPEQVK